VSLVDQAEGELRDLFGRVRHREDVFALTGRRVDDARDVAAASPLDGQIEIEVPLDGRRRLLSYR